MGDHERLVMQNLRQDEATQLDELIERLEEELGSAEIFTALFELELAGRVKQMPGKNYVKSFLMRSVNANKASAWLLGFAGVYFCVVLPFALFGLNDEDVLAAWLLYGSLAALLPISLLTIWKTKAAGSLLMLDGFLGLIGCALSAAHMAAQRLLSSVEALGHFWFSFFYLHSWVGQVYECFGAQMLTRA